jgi:deoxyribonuclease-4
MRTKKEYEHMWQEFDATVGLQHLHAIHINDSKKELDSHVDRHEHIGQGKIGDEAFELLMNDSRFFDIPKILETPKGEDELKDDARNMRKLEGFMTGRTLLRLSTQASSCTS